MGLIQPETFGCFISSLQVRGDRWRGCFGQEEEKDQAVTDVTWASYLCSCILRVITWWTSCSISATVASGASVTQDRGTGFHLPTWIRPEHTHTHEHRNMRQQQTCFMFFYSSSICVLHLWPVLRSCASSPVSAGPSLSAGWTADLSWPAQTQRVLLSSLFPEGSPCAPPRRTPATDSLRWRTHIISQSMTQMRLICNIMFPERGKIHTELPHVSSCTSAVPVLALWPRCGRFLGSRTPLPAPLLGRGSRSVLFQPSQLGRRGPGVYNGINALGFLGTITQGVHLWRHTDTETQTLKN